ncbi:hypothetical protein FHG87_021157 [Trinorchestia longiramus]|nr:hypothetical protein FHG87_021157 [Trinorchestia longiramus]
MQAKCTREWAPPQPVWPWETRKFSNCVSFSKRKSGHPAANHKGHRDARRKGGSSSGTKLPGGQPSERNFEFRTPRTAAQCIKATTLHSNTGPPRVQHRHTEEHLSYSAQPGVQYTDLAEMMCVHPTVQVSDLRFILMPLAS